MTKGEIALELTKHFSSLVRVVGGADNAQNVVDFYNTIYNGIKVEEQKNQAKFG